MRVDKIEIRGPRGTGDSLWPSVAVVVRDHSCPPGRKSSHPESVKATSLMGGDDGA